MNNEVESVRVKCTEHIKKESWRYILVYTTLPLIAFIQGMCFGSTSVLLRVVSIACMCCMTVSAILMTRAQIGASFFTGITTYLDAKRQDIQNQLDRAKSP